jgi:hypothetical protein
MVPETGFEMHENRTTSSFHQNHIHNSVPISGKAMDLHYEISLINAT